MALTEDIQYQLLEAVRVGLPLSRAALLYGLTPDELAQFEIEQAVELNRSDAQREFELLQLHKRAQVSGANKGISRPIEQALAWLDPKRYGNQTLVGLPTAVVRDDL